MVITYRALLCESTEALLNCSDTPRLDAEILLSHLLGRERVWLAVHADDAAEEEICLQMRTLTARRANHEPIAYLVGTREFMGLPFRVRPGVLIPRPDTETLTEAVLKENTAEHPKIIDLCTGSGAIAVSLAHFIPGAAVAAVDFSEICVRTARENAEENNVGARVNVICADILHENFAEDFFRLLNSEEKADILVSNPPYIRSSELSVLMPDVRDYEPSSALDGGEDGLIFYRRIAQLAPALLWRGGLLALEAGYDQADDIAELLDRNGFCDIRFALDLSGIRRVVLARRD